VDIPVGLKPGRIVWVNVLDTWNNPTEDHLAVILSSREAIEAGEPIAVVVISSEFEIAPPEEQVMLPWQNCHGGHSLTHLYMNCAAMCGWYRKINSIEEILSYEGVVPAYALNTIKRKVEERLKKLATLQTTPPASPAAPPPLKTPPALPPSQ
jgi:hypothetical protein